jgi:hypothetical protein
MKIEPPNDMFLVLALLVFVCLLLIWVAKVYG